MNTSRILIVTWFILFFAVQSLAQWEVTSGPVTRNIYGLGYFEGTYYACLGLGGVYSSLSPNFNWQEIYQTGGTTPVCKSDGQHLYITNISGLFRTMDGINWQIIDTVEGHDLCVSNEGVLVRDQTMIGYSLYSLLYLSRDHGDTWRQINVKGTYDYVALKDTTILLGTTDGKLHISRDFGNTWIDTTINIPGIFFIGANANKDFFFLASYDDGIYRSTDAISWEKVFDCPGVGMTKNIGIQGSNVFIVTDTSVGLFFSTNNGTSWENVTHGFKYYSYHDFEMGYITPYCLNDNLFLSTRGNGLFILDSIKKSWTPISTGLSDISVYYLLSSDSVLFAGSLWDIDMCTSTDTGKTWNTYGPVWSLADEMDGMAVNSNSVYAVRGKDGLNLGISKSSDYGRTWNQILKFTTEIIYPIFALDSMICGAMSRGIKLSWNDGAIWTDYIPTFPDANFTAFGGMGSELYAGTYRGSIYYSTDKGHTWDTLSTPAIDSMITAINVTPSAIVIGTYGQGVFISFDHGQTWNQTNEGISDTFVLTLSISGSAQFISTLGGFAFASGDYGQHWHEITDGLEGTRINIIYATNGYVFAGTRGNGIWRRPITEVINVIDYRPKDEIPSTYILYQNYPNPFNPTTTIQFGLSEAENVELNIFNIVGQKVATLVQSHLAAGWHTVKWDASEFASGIYIYTMKAGKHTLSRKLLLLR